MKRYFDSYKSLISVASIWISGGSNQDKNEKKGINQILCSLLTRGCKNYDKYQFSEYIDSFGAELSYQTFDDGILISIKSLNENFKSIYFLLDLIIEKPDLLEREFINCKNYSKNNLIKLRENSFNIALNNWKRIVYKDHPYAFGINGSLEDLKNINYEDLISEFNNFKLRKKYLLTNHYFENIENIKTINYESKDFEPFNKNEKILSLNESRFVSCHKKISQISILMGNKTCPHSSKEYLILKVLESYLSYGMSSELFKEFREKNGLTYEISTLNSPRINFSPFLIYLSVSNNNSPSALKLLISLWKRLLSELIPIDDLNLAKIKLKSLIRSSNQTTESFIQRKVFLIGQKVNPIVDQKLFKFIDNVSSEDILESVNKYFQYPYLSLIGEEKICKVLKEIWIKSY